MSKRTCFVVSPIGDDGSETRKNADDVFELLIQPALEPFHFDVVRADKIPGPTSINEDVIRLVQDSDLCVVDLTERNPNVFYECGRRHEAGKPAILIIRKGEKIPFDLAGIRTIAYDLTDARTARAAVKSIQDFVREIEKAGFSEISSGATLTNVMDTLVRIERKIAAMHGGTKALSGLGGSGRQQRPADLKSLARGPLAAIQDAIMSGDIPSISAALPRLEAMLGPVPMLVPAAAIAAINGDSDAVELLYRLLEAPESKLNLESKKGAVAGIVQFYVNTERAKEGIGRFSGAVLKLLSQGKPAPKEGAFLHNQLQMLYYDAEMYQEALEHSEKAVALHPVEPAYHYNQSLILAKLGLTKRALGAVDKFLDMGSSEPDHLSQAYAILAKCKLFDRAQEVLDKLRQVDPMRAELAEQSSMNEPEQEGA